MISPNIAVEELQQTWKSQRKKLKHDSTNKHYMESHLEYLRLEDRYFDVLKNSTILSGSIFASSIALASGRNVSITFMVGELMLLVATLVGIIYLWNHLNVREWSYFLHTKGGLESDLLLYEDAMDEFEAKIIKEQIASYGKLLDKKSLLNGLFRVIKPDWLTEIFYGSLIVGLLLIWISLMCR